MNGTHIARLEVATEGDELVILEQLDDRDVAVAIMDDEGNEVRARLRKTALVTALRTVGAS